MCARPEIFPQGQKKMQLQSRWRFYKFKLNLNKVSDSLYVEQWDVSQVQ